MAGKEGWVEGFELEQASKEDCSWISQKMGRSMTAQDGSRIPYEIKRIQKVKNSTLWFKYAARRQEMAKDLVNGEKVSEMHLFHGTDQADYIAKQGFDVDKANLQAMFGKGIYFANRSAKSNLYTFEGYNTPCKHHNDADCDQCLRKLLLCRVALGKMYEATTPMNGIREPPQGHHSVVAYPKPNFLKNPEYVIYHNHQAYPGFLIEYKVLP